MSSVSVLKDTEYEWIGSIPSHWELLKIKYVFWDRKENNNPIKTDNLISLTIDKGVIPHSEKTGGGNKPKEDLSKYKLVYPGDIVLNSMNVIAGAVGISRYFGVVSPVYYMLIPRNVDHSNEYFHHLFRTETFQKSLYGLGNGILIKENEKTGKLNTIRMRIPMDKLGNQFIPVPPPEEQELISRYLDKKTEQIDSLIEKIQKKIKLLKEQRTSLINQYVTKGLDPNVEMKDSGVEWIGEIPSHWDVKKFSYVSRLETGNTPSKTQEDLYFTDDEDGFPWVKPSDLNVGVLGVSETESRLTEEGKLESRVVPKDSILICCIGNTSGKYSITNTELSTNQQINSITFDETVLPRYGLFYMDVFGRDLLKWMNFVTLPIISKGDLSQQPILVPPSKEQGFISDYLDEQMEIYLSIVTKENRRVQLLSEYRQSLISSVATGKVRVTEDMV